MQNQATDSVRLILDVTNSTIDPGNAGVVRVARRFGRELQNVANPIFVVWDPLKAGYGLPTLDEYERLSRFHGPAFDPAGRVSPDLWNRVSLQEVLGTRGSACACLICPETLSALRCRLIRPYARRLDLTFTAIFHDAIPVLRPDLVNAAIRVNHKDYMLGLAACDFVMTVSRFSADSLRDVWRRHDVFEVPVVVNSLPAEFAGSSRGESGPGPSHPVEILCVSTLEPRKNHPRLLEACLRLLEMRPELEWCLTLVGGRYTGAPHIIDLIERATAATSRIQWLRVVDDETLSRLYAECSFTVYPSTIEGFGMPILESLWHARPCLCSDQGSMGELAAQGGCLTVNVEDVCDLSAAIGRLIEDTALRHRLSMEAASRKLKRWRDYAEEFLGILQAAP